jgi:hypothetical protein
MSTSLHNKDSMLFATVINNAEKQTKAVSNRFYTNGNYIGTQRAGEKCQKQSESFIAQSPLQKCLRNTHSHSNL